MSTRPAIWFLGPEGTHSHEACRRAFPGGFEPRPCRTVREALERVAHTAPEAAGGPVVAVVPVENAIEGPVTQTLDWLADTPGVGVRGALRMPIHHDLLTASGTVMSAVRTVFSHPQALAQCAGWLVRYLPDALQVPVASTAEAARRAAAEPGTAAIASAAAGRLHGLVSLAACIEDDPQNETRFLILAPDAVRPEDLPPVAGGAAEGPRALLQLDLANTPGSLLHALEPFEREQLNLTFIQSRPRRRRPWEYRFFVEVDVRPGPAPVARALEALQTCCERVRVLGTYPGVRIEEPAAETGGTPA